MPGMLDLYEKRTGEKFPIAGDQLLGAIEAVFKSWNNDRAKTYRKLNKISENLGTAVVLQAMVFGNLNDKSGTGVLFTRDLNNGEAKLNGEFLIKAQGEDLVAGIRHGDPLSKVTEWNPALAKELAEMGVKLEKLTQDVQDIEWTVQDGKLFLLQTRPAKRTALAAIKIAADLAKEGVIKEAEAVKRVTFKQYVSVLRPVIAPEFVGKPIGEGLPASIGLASGKAVFSSADAVNSTEPCILIGEETTPNDIAGMNAAKGVLTAKGGATSHAAVVARGMDKPCVVGCNSMEFKVTHAKFTMGGEVYTVNPGDMISIDGSTGNVYLGTVPTVDASNNPALVEFAELVERRAKYYRVCVSLDEVNGSGAVLFGTYLLDFDANPGFRMLETAKGLSGRNVIFDLRSYEDVMLGKSDHPLLDVFGTETSATGAKIDGLVTAAKGIDKSSMLVLENGLTENQVGTLRSAGYSIVPVVDDEETLSKVSGLVQADMNVLLGILGKDKLRELIASKKASGEAVRSFNIVGKVKASDFKSGAAFALSRVNLIRSMLS
jgi:phosphohistidine swiveling domain-containing protein